MGGHGAFQDMAPTMIQKTRRGRPGVKPGGNESKDSERPAHGRHVSNGPAKFLERAPPDASWREVIEAIQEGIIPEEWRNIPKCPDCETGLGFGGEESTFCPDCRREVTRDEVGVGGEGDV